jgi:hypothetical protein
VERALFLRGSVAVNNELPRALLRLWWNAEADEKVLRGQVTRFVLALRRDCGQSTFGLESEDWSDLLDIPSSSVASEQNAGTPPRHFKGIHAAPPTHRLSRRA